MTSVIEREGNTNDLIAVLRVSPMTPKTRAATIQSVRAFREALSGVSEVPISELSAALASADLALRSRLGSRHSQILCDCNRAMRAWSDTSRRRLVLGLRSRIPTLEDAKSAAYQIFSPEKAARIAAAIDEFATWHSSKPDAIAAMSIVVEPMLRTSRMETFGVSTRKSLSNKLGHIRAAVGLVDPSVLHSRVSDIAALPPVWHRVLDCLKVRTPAHAKSVTAIFSRLAVSAAHEGLPPHALPDSFLDAFLMRERTTKSDSHAEKLRAASRIWNECRLAGELQAVPFNVTCKPLRLPDVRWSSVPQSIRDPFDALAASITCSQADTPWSASIGEEVSISDLELGIAGLGHVEPEPQELSRQPGTVKNWRDAIKRVWHACQHDPLVVKKPDDLEELFRSDCAISTVRAIRTARRARVEAAGETWGGLVKGSYETSLLQSFMSVGRALNLDEEQLRPIQNLIYQIDPNIIGSTTKSDGTRKYIYEERKIGPRHAKMLRSFSDIAVFGRWLQAPSTIMAQVARLAKRRGPQKQPTIGEAAMARTAIIAQLSQRVSPLRRTNLARLRISGDAPHLELPIGEGEGTLRLPACEMKNLRSVTVRIDADTVALIKAYIETYRPVCMKYAKAHEANEHLFPGAEGHRKEKASADGYAPGFGYLTKEKLNTVFSKHMRKHCMLEMDLHVMRHLAAKVILDQDPSAMALVQEILGHLRITTTRAYYAEVSQLVAQRRYLDLLDRATRRALAKVDFTIQLSQALKGA